MAWSELTIRHKSFGKLAFLNSIGQHSWMEMCEGILELGCKHARDNENRTQGRKNHGRAAPAYCMGPTHAHHCQMTSAWLTSWLGPGFNNSAPRRTLKASIEVPEFTPPGVNVKIWPLYCDGYFWISWSSCPIRDLGLQICIPNFQILSSGTE